jgi:hypothetical protein
MKLHDICVIFKAETNQPQVKHNMKKHKNYIYLDLLFNQFYENNPGNDRKFNLPSSLKCHRIQEVHALQGDQCCTHCPKRLQYYFAGWQTKKNRKPCLYHILNVGIPVRPLIDSFDSNINILARNPGLFEESLLEEPRLKSLKILGQQRQIEN